jgi:hypothetical protein
LTLAGPSLVEIVPWITVHQRPIVGDVEQHELHADDRISARANYGLKLVSADSLELVTFIEVPSVVPVLSSANSKLYVALSDDTIMRSDVVLELAPEE